MRWPWSGDRAAPSLSREAAPPPSPEGARQPRRDTPRPTPAADDRPVWLLDVDGVLNASRPDWDGDVAEGPARAGGVPFRIRWSPALVQRIVALDDSGRVEIRWATTWVPWIDQIEQLLGLPSWPVAWSGPFEGVSTPAIPTPLRKVQTALHVVEQERRPLIWTDDDAIPLHGPEHDRILSADVPCLLVRPATRTGLQPQEMDAIEAFVRRYA